MIGPLQKLCQDPARVCVGRFVSRTVYCTVPAASLHRIQRPGIHLALSHTFRKTKTCLSLSGFHDAQYEVVYDRLYHPFLSLQCAAGIIRC
jgi:hypothetical protein